jgi:L-aminopeptidase/D-esterase-like protein
VITAVPGIRVGHFTDRDGLTGCTVVLCPPGTVGSGEVRGGAPATRETDLLRPGMLVKEVHAVLLTGGSAFGLAAADGVLRFLEEQGIGFDAQVARVPIVPTAALFDLAVGDPRARPGPDQGYAACLAAGPDPPEGTVGAGTGATVAKLNGPQGAVKAGVGSASQRQDDAIVAVLVAVNAVGEVLDERGEVLAGSRVAPGPPGPPSADPTLPFGTNTTIGVVATNTRLSKERAHFLAQAAHEGLDRALRPAHTMWDGDTVFSLATGETDAPQQELEEMAVETMAQAIRNAVRRAGSVPGVPSIGDLS